MSKNELLNELYFQLPLDLNSLSESERKARLEARKPRKAVKVLKEVEDNFHAMKYMKMINKKKQRERY